MPTAADVLRVLIPQGGWASSGDKYEDIEFLDCEPITKQQFDAAVAQYDSLKAAENAKATADKEAAQAKLAALGLTADDLKALGL
jgi:hypothetical protein